MTEASDLKTLIERLEKAEAGSEELSALVMQSLVVPGGSVRQSPFNGAWCVYEGLRLWEQRGGWHRPEGWKVTTSLDAALALAERLDLSAMYILQLALDHGRRHGPIPLTVERLVREVCIAILRAKEASQ